MKLNFEKKYKERDPQETIKIIQNFFQSKNCNINIKTLQQNDSNTWSAHLELFYDNIKILTSNGKGISKDYCLASGHAELYERFCNKIYSLPNSLINQKIMDLSYNINGYYFSPKEKEISFEDSFNSVAGDFFLKHMQSNETELREFFKILFNNKFIGVPYKSVNSQNISYIDPRFSLLLNNSSGMAAGNTFYEAFNQAMSEIYEHYVSGRHYSEQFEKYYFINLNCIKNNKLQEIIKTIQENNELYIIDMSYNFNVPVLMSLIVNKQTHSISINFGAFPVLEIAIERVLTELYQGIQHYDEIKISGQIPSKNYSDLRLLEGYWPSCTMTRPIFSEFIINNLEEKDSFNTNVFLIGDYSNIEIYNYILNLNEKLNFEVYYYNSSLINDMYAINVFVKNIPYLIDNFSFANKIPDKSKHLLFILKLNKLLSDYLEYGILDINNLLTLLNENNLFYTTYDRYYLNIISARKNQFTVASYFASSQNTLDFIDRFINNESLFINKQEENKFIKENAEIFYENLITYLITKRYINKINEYDSNEIIKILKFLNLNISNEDILNCINNDKKYWVEKIFFIDLNNIKMGKYNDYLKMMATCNWVE